MTGAPGGEQLQIRLLGDFAVWVGHVAVPGDAWRLRKAKSLVKLLALAPEHRMHRERVGELLWPDRDADSVANNLHQAVFVARRALDAARAGAGACLALVQETLTLTGQGAVEVDVDVFEAAAARAREQRTQAAHAAALGLYGGELLPDDLYEHWTLARRQALKEQHVGLLLGLAELHARDGQSAAAVEVAQQAVVEAPLHEGAQRALMRFFVADGRRQQALVQYEQLRNALRRELEAKPDPETRRLYREILAEPGDAEPAPDEPRPAAPDTRFDRGKLPLALTSFIGRARERTEIEGLLRRSRLLTLIGPGGCGKTRLALEVAAALAHDFEQVVFLVELAPIADPALIAQQTATALGIELRSERAPADVVAEQIGERRMLLLLDNCEHLIASTAQFASHLLRSCSRLQVLATSREPLRVLGEIAWRVPSLTLPDASGPLDLADLAGVEAVRLFVERAAGVSRGFRLDSSNAAAVVEICLRLDGMPLALELAAARTAALSPVQMAERLRQSFNVLGRGNRGALTRQQTLAATIGWSYDLLDADERTLFRRLSVFAGAFSLDAAETICSDEVIDRVRVADVLGRLVEKSLVVAGEDAGESTYRLLETVRQYAGERLAASDEGARLISRHRAFYLALAEANDPDLGEAPGFAARLEREHDNVRAALASALAHDPEAALRLCAHICAFWMARGYFAEGARWLDEALAAAPARTSLRARALLHRCGLAVRRGQVDMQCATAHESIEILRERGDRRALADALQQTAMIECQSNDFGLGLRLLEESGRIAESLGDPGAIAAVRHCQGVIACWQADHERASRSFGQAVDLFGQVSDARTPEFPVHSVGLVVIDEEPDRPRGCYEDTFFVFRRVIPRAAAGWTLANLSVAQRLGGQLDLGRESLEQALGIFEDLGDAMGRAMVLNALGNLARARGEFEQGRRSLEGAMALRRELRDRRGIAIALCNLAMLEAKAGDLERARQLLEEARETFTRTDDKPGLMIVQHNLGNIELATGAWVKARAALERGRALAVQQAIKRQAGWVSLTLAEGALDHGEPSRATVYLAEARRWLAGFGDMRAEERIRRLGAATGD